MCFEKLLITQGLEKIIEWIEDLPHAILTGAGYVVLVLIALWFVIYFLLYQAIFNGLWLRALIIVGVWLFIEFLNWLGGGHRN